MHNSNFVVFSDEQQVIYITAKVHNDDEAGVVLNQISSSLLLLLAV